MAGISTRVRNRQYRDAQWPTHLVLEQPIDLAGRRLDQLMHALRHRPRPLTAVTCRHSTRRVGVRIDRRTVRRLGRRKTVGVEVWAGRADDEAGRARKDEHAADGWVRRETRERLLDLGRSGLR